MKPTLKNLLMRVARQGEVEAFMCARRELDSDPEAQAEYDKIMEEELQERLRHREHVVGKGSPHDSAETKRVNQMQVK
ncbi:hypothetical protein CCP3SC15_3340003 [Gammaproteobacteria bacterium]